MGRKSLATERTSQILDAFETCIVRHGLEGATLQRIANEAGMRVSMIDHYIGKRDALVEAMTARFFKTYKRDTAAFLATLPVEDRLTHLLDFYFSDASLQYRSQDTIIMGELMTVSERDVAVREQLIGIYRLIESGFYDVIRQQYPQVSAETAAQTAYALMSLWYGNSSFIWLGFDQKRLTWVRHSAELLVQTLDKVH
ncbi:MAG: TetR/AcrR family transcriptional regulator [Candidatus Promineifilaceae bacterium]